MRLFINKKPNATVLFHNSDERRFKFTSKIESRPTFYWFSDRYADFINNHYEIPNWKYFHLFIVKPSDNAKLFTRHKGGRFLSMWEDYQTYCDHVRGLREDLKYTEPGIVLSFDLLEPKIICRIHENFIAEVIRPIKYRGEKFQFVINSKPVPFNDIPLLMKIAPELSRAVPVLQPTDDELINDESFWLQDEEHAGDYWL